MAQEVETKILEIDRGLLIKQIALLGGVKISECRLVVDWFGPAGLTHKGDDPWFLRVRSYSNGKHEVTWKGKSDVLGASRKHKEINYEVSDPVQQGYLFESIGLERYAHQEKDRISWNLKNWRLDLDTYPGMPSYLEIEGESEESIQEAIKLLNLQDRKTYSDGERTLIQSEYGLNWSDMKF